MSATDGPATANSLRGSELRRLLAEQRTWLWIGGPAVALGLFTLTRDPANAWVGPLFVLVAESAALDKHYEIFVGKGQDEVWTRRLSSPSFVVWLAESSPKKLSFELVDGTLVTYVPGHQEDAKSLDRGGDGHGRSTPAAGVGADFLELGWPP